MLVVFGCFYIPYFFKDDVRIMFKVMDSCLNHQYKLPLSVATGNGTFFEDCVR